jgi:hypothetical protein
LRPNRIIYLLRIANGAFFFPDPQGYNALRLNFSHQPEVIERVIAVLGKLLKDDRNRKVDPRIGTKDWGLGVQVANSALKSVR